MPRPPQPPPLPADEPVAAGLTAADVDHLGRYFAKKDRVPLRLRDDAAAAFTLGVLRAVPRLDGRAVGARAFLYTAGLWRMRAFVAGECCRPRPISLDAARRQADDDTFADRIAAAPEARQADGIPRCELAAILEAALRRACRPRDRQAVRLHFLEGQTVAYTAAALGVSPPRVGQFLRRALGRLRRHLVREHPGLAAVYFADPPRPATRALATADRRDAIPRARRRPDPAPAPEPH